MSSSPTVLGLVRRLVVWSVLYIVFVICVGTALFLFGAVAEQDAERLGQMAAPGLVILWMFAVLIYALQRARSIRDKGR